MKNRIFPVLILIVSLSLAGCAGAPPKQEGQKEWDAEKAKLYEEMGAAYTKAELYKEAIDAYSTSLKYGPNNADVHYYLGLLWQKYNKDVQKAVFHFKKYLYLKPDSPKRDEVRYLIEMVQNKR